MRASHNCSNSYFHSVRHQCYVNHSVNFENITISFALLIHNVNDNHNDDGDDVNDDVLYT